MNWRSLALDIGGRFLVRELLRLRRNRFRQMRDLFPLGALLPKADLTAMDAVNLRLEWEEQMSDAALPSWLASDPSDLTESERALIRHRFMDAVNLPAPLYRNWLLDPRVRDGAPALIYYRQMREHIRRALYIKATGRLDGMGWLDNHYETARRAIFVISSIRDPRKIDYTSWVILRNFGHDWTRRKNGVLVKKLPPAVLRQAQQSLDAYKIRGV
jgi:hypothetical protein